MVLGVTQHDFMPTSIRVKHSISQAGIWTKHMVEEPRVYVLRTQVFMCMLLLRLA